MKYSKALTLGHPVSLSHPECLKKINDVNISEGFDGETDLFNDDIVVLDMDCVESKNAIAGHRANKSSMDCTFAIEDKTTGENKMLLVELRYNYVNMQNLTRKKLIDKVDGSTSALGSDVDIQDETIFIFKSDLKEQARSRLFRMMPRVPSNYIVQDIYELKSIYFD